MDGRPNKYKTFMDSIEFDDESLLDDEESDENRKLDQESVFTQGETRDFLRFLRSIKYDHRQVPDGKEGSPVTVNVSVVVSNVRSVSEITMDYALEIFYREAWRDPRLKYSKKKFKNKTSLSLHESYSNFLWHPDTFVPNAIASKNPRKQSVTHRSLLRLNPDGRILFSRRLSLILSCGMDLTLFPFDTQVCKLGIESYGHTADQVSYAWSDGDITALQLNKVSLPDFRIEKAFVTSRVEKYATGDYSRLYVCFVFSRAAGFCFLQLIVPSTAGHSLNPSQSLPSILDPSQSLPSILDPSPSVVITSWVCLWMENETSFQDMISIILTITFLLFSYNEVMPRVSYLKAMDVWLGVCFIIVFFSLIKLALLKYMQQKLRKDSLFYDLRHLSTRRKCVVQNWVVTSGALPPPVKAVSNGFGTKSHVLISRNNRVCTDRFVRAFHWSTQILFILTFVLFCLFFFFGYQNIHQPEMDQDCNVEIAQFFAEIR
ncbi:hypothetical protein PENTCL1PPCAC_17717 [Pristionchus entomophagus]|uniref:Uncharacterized protein n=1 Tax=Pristionchus entomophagus TaxID=358040 RepID=A0AAV5TMQ5_9BILA|nr:hypothetical protein PENTCL1PPCAC_17717 [Pristionchus entomophagus]